MKSKDEKILVGINISLSLSLSLSLTHTHTHTHSHSHTYAHTLTVERYTGLNKEDKRGTVSMHSLQKKVRRMQQAFTQMTGLRAKVCANTLL